jgi:hypothetical protein
MTYKDVRFGSVTGFLYQLESLVTISGVTVRHYISHVRFEVFTVNKKNGDFCQAAWFLKEPHGVTSQKTPFFITFHSSYLLRLLLELLELEPGTLLCCLLLCPLLLLDLLYLCLST